jgi:hypothetical protein
LQETLSQLVEFLAHSSPQARQNRATDRRIISDALYAP